MAKYDPLCQVCHGAPKMDRSTCCEECWYSGRYSEATGDRCPHCNAIDKADRRLQTPSFGPAPFGYPCTHAWHGSAIAKYKHVVSKGRSR